MPFYDNAIFSRVTGEGTEGLFPSQSPRRVKYAVSLIPLKSAAITPFSFPFGNVLRVRDALKLQSLPYAAAGEMELFPSILKKTPRSSEGIAWFVSSKELEDVASLLARVPSRGEARVWPAPLPLAAAVEGEGVVFWMDEENICSMLWRGGVPVLYRWKSRKRADLDSERAWYTAYCESKGEEGTGQEFVLDASQSSARLLEVVRKSLTLYPWICDVNLARSALDNVLVLERAVRALSRAASWVLAVGLLVFLGNGLRYYEARRGADELRDLSSDLYRSVFDPARAGRIPDPLGLALSKLAELQGGTSEGRSIDEVFSNLGSIFEQNPSMDVTLDLVRYNQEGVDYTGSAPDMETAQDFRKAWAERAGTVLLQNMQNISGASYRFDLSVKW